MNIRLPPEKQLEHDMFCQAIKKYWLRDNANSPYKATYYIWCIWKSKP